MFLSQRGKDEPQKRASLHHSDPQTKFSRRIILDRDTHLGRVSFPTHLSPRTLPDVFQRAKIAVNIDGDNMISRNHALLILEQGDWALFDLNSLNGTSVNDKMLEPGEGRILRSNDVISLSPSTQLTFHLENPDVVENTALLVGNPGVPLLKGVETDLATLHEALNLRKQFNGNISTLFNSSAARQAIITALQGIASISSDDSVSLFYFSGHGSRTGGLCVFDGNLNPLELFSELANIRGRKLVILDCCHSSAFLSGVLPPNTLVVTGESPTGHLYEGAVSTGINGAQAKMRQGFLTRAFIKVLERFPGKINLKQIAKELGKYHRLAHRDVEVMITGTTLYLHSVWKPSR